MATRRLLLFFLISILLLLMIFKFTLLSKHIVLSPNQACKNILESLAFYFLSKGNHVYIDIDSNYYQKLIRQSRSIDVNEKDMVVLNGNNFSQFMTENRLVMEVGSIGSQCDYWSREPAKEYRGGEVVLVKLPAYIFKQKKLIEGSPTIYFYQHYYDDDGDDTFRKIEEYDECGRKAVMTWVKSKMRLGVYSITTMDEAKRISVDESKLVLGFLRTLEGPEIEELAAASKLFSDINFYQTTSVDVAELFHIDPHIKRPALIFLHTVTRNYSIFDGQFTRSAIADFVSEIKLPVEVTLTVENPEQIFQNPMKQIIAYRNYGAKQHELNGELNLSSIKSFGEDFLEDKLSSQPKLASETVLKLPSHSHASDQLHFHILLGRLLVVYLLFVNVEMNFELGGIELPLEFGTTVDGPTIVGRKQYFSYDYNMMNDELTLSNIKSFGDNFLGDDKRLSQWELDLARQAFEPVPVGVGFS
ncbi:hypothetical protein QYF36_007793 [Acer negundo]|nr:hypothetical protein QYF36_007793 [Acer negundo]